jgi:hypothetical protein
MNEEEVSELTALVGEPLKTWPTMEAVHAGNIANIICSCIEYQGTEKTAKTFVGIYLEMIKSI